MKHIACLFTLLFQITFTCVLFTPQAAAYTNQEFLALCYHDIPKEGQGDEFGVDEKSFIETIEFFLSNGYKFMSMSEIIDAQRHQRNLPDKAVLLTFDDGYRSYYDFVFPILERYKIPSVLAVVTRWLDEKPPSLKYYELMDRDQLREVAKSGLVEIASHSHNLHQGVFYNSYGNEAAAAANRIYNPQTQNYETQEKYRARIRDDLAEAKKRLENDLGVKARVLAWPYGKYNQITLEEAKNAGFEYTLVLNDRIAQAGKLDEINRILIKDNPTIKDWIKEIKYDFQLPEHQRIVQVDLDLVYDPDPVKTEENLGRLLDRILGMKPTTVFLQAYADPSGDGNIRSVYFPNRLLPVRADIFNRAVHQLKTRTEVAVYAWMPVLSYVLPDPDRDAMRVWEYDGLTARPSQSWYERLSPFHPMAKEKIKMIYEDMAINAFIDGVIFQDDAYLNDYEDFNPAAQEEYLKRLGKKVFLARDLNEEALWDWTSFKTDTLIRFTEELKQVVRKHRPETRFARTFYAEVLTKPYTEEWYAQDYEKSIEAYDFVVVMAYPRMEKVRRPKAWLKKMVSLASNHPQGLQKTVFKLQAYDWDRNKWIPSKTIRHWMRVLVAAGARHIGYYPDNFSVDQPQQEIVRTMISVEDFPFKVKKYQRV